MDLKGRDKCVVPSLEGDSVAVRQIVHQRPGVRFVEPQSLRRRRPGSFGARRNRLGIFTLRRRHRRCRGVVTFPRPLHYSRHEPSVLLAEFEQIIVDAAVSIIFARGGGGGVVLQFLRSQVSIGVPQKMSQFVPIPQTQQEGPPQFVRARLSRRYRYVRQNDLFPLAIRLVRSSQNRRGLLREYHSDVRTYYCATATATATPDAPPLIAVRTETEFRREHLPYPIEARRTFHIRQGDANHGAIVPIEVFGGGGRRRSGIIARRRRRRPPHSSSTSSVDESRMEEKLGGRSISVVHFDLFPLTKARRFAGVGVGVSVGVIANVVVSVRIAPLVAVGLRGSAADENSLARRRTFFAIVFVVVIVIIPGIDHGNVRFARPIGILVIHHIPERNEAVRLPDVLGPVGGGDGDGVRAPRPLFTDRSIEVRYEILPGVRRRRRPTKQLVGETLHGDQVVVVHRRGLRIIVAVAVAVAVSPPLLANFGRCRSLGVSALEQIPHL
mmetsp:Transcript_36167/g.108282  ORF Transcript_36167/g.108282 Transcript_36167/m.108282 type:complete len:497 (+) Transcript_36167:447-1937(+)